MVSLLFLPVTALLWAAQISGTPSTATSSDCQDAASWKTLVAESTSLFQQRRISDSTRVLEAAAHCAEHFEPLDPRLPTTLHSLAFLYREQGRLAEAETLCLRAVDLWEKIGPTQHDAWLQSMIDLSATYLQSRNYPAAKKLMERLLPEIERSATNWKAHVTILGTRGALADAERRYGDAERFYRQALALLQEHDTEEGLDAGIVWMNLSEVLVNSKRYDESLAADLRALAALEKVGASAVTLVVRVLDRAAFLSLKLKRPGDAEAYYQRLLPTATQAFGPEHPMVGRIMLSYAAVLGALRRNSDAAVMSTQAHTILKGGGRSVDILALTARH